jgi:hypothetical protein
MKNLFSLGLAFLLALTVTGCSLYFGEERDSDGDAYCAADGYYVRGEWVSAQCPGGGNACATNDDCAAGCHCDEATGSCKEAGFCSDATDCPDGYKCDERSSCVPGGGSCAGAIAPTCTNGAPRCPEGSVPLIEKGCYFDQNGDGQFDCSAISECAAPPTCQALQHSDDCATAGCTTITRGENCTSANGQACQDGQAGCICQMYSFARCE